MTQTRQARIAELEAEIAKLKEEEKASRPELAPGQVWRHPDHGYSVYESPGIMWSVFGNLPMGTGVTGLDEAWQYVGLSRDVLHVVELNGNDEGDADLRAIQERDEWEEKATKLADAVGRLLGVDVGEHSSSNCPVENAMFAIHEREVKAEAHDTEPTGAELVGKACWVKWDSDTEWRHIEMIERCDPSMEMQYCGKSGKWWDCAKLYREGVEP